MAIVNRLDLTAVADPLADWLTRQLGADDPVHVTKLAVPSDGMNSETVIFTASWTADNRPREGKFVARVQPVGEAVLYSYNLANEARVIDVLGSHTGVPVPRLIGVEEDPVVLGTPFLVTGFVEGRIPPDAPPFPVEGWVLDLSPDERRRMQDDALAVLAELHRSDWKGLGLDILARPELGSEPLDQVIEYWRRFYQWGTAGQSNQVVEGAFDWVAANRPTATEPTVLSWGDSRIGNMIFGADLRVAAVIDFDLATLASPELDLGWWLWTNRHHSEGFGVPLPEGVYGRDETIARYQELSGHELRYADYYEVLGALRFAVLMVRAGHLMMKLGTLPPDHPMPLNNPATQWLAHTLDLPAPEGAASSFLTGEGR